ncbi:vesicle-associated membrane protein 1 isoform X2 [Phyllobates terribilis]|uniref:vesicle-associated membrane protein 1 isoform X2 n=1 Tax=Phyllobates terribilis TaxID=111132 RepID=UPI003CCADD5F
MYPAAETWRSPADTAGDMSPPAAPQYSASYSPLEPDADVSSNPGIRLTQEQIDEVVRIMEANVDSIVEVDVSELEGVDSSRSGGGFTQASADDRADRCCAARYYLRLLLHMKSRENRRHQQEKSPHLLQLHPIPVMPVVPTLLPRLFLCLIHVVCSEDCTVQWEMF